MIITAILVLILVLIVIIVIIMIKANFLKSENVNLQNLILELESSNAELVSKNTELQNNSNLYQARLEAQKELVAEFERLRDDSQKVTKAALFDLGNELSKQLIEIHKKETSEARNISEKHINDTAKKFHGEFERIVSMVGSLNKEINNSRDTVDLIKNSLLSPSSGGRLAEISLENLLKNSGLKVGVDFSLQYKALGEQGNKLRPDAVIFLPADEVMVIDVKTSKFLVEQEKMFNNFERTGNRSDYSQIVTKQKAALAKTMNMHLKSLATKDYAEAVANSVDRKKVSKIITIMFLPTEHALERIYEADPEFINVAYANNILPVGPAGLMSILSTAKYRITEKRMIDNHKYIMEEVKKLVSSISNLTEYSEKLANNIKSLVGNYDKFAGSFNYNFLKRAVTLSNLGASGNKKNIPKNLERYQLVSHKSEVIEIEAVSTIGDEVIVSNEHTKQLIDDFSVSSQFDRDRVDDIDTESSNARSKEKEFA